MASKLGDKVDVFATSNLSSRGERERERERGLRVFIFEERNSQATIP